MSTRSRPLCKSSCSTTVPPVLGMCKNVLFSDHADHHSKAGYAQASVRSFGCCAMVGERPAIGTLAIVTSRKNPFTDNALWSYKKRHQDTGPSHKVRQGVKSYSVAGAAAQTSRSGLWNPVGPNYLAET